MLFLKPLASRNVIVSCFFIGTYVFAGFAGIVPGHLVSADEPKVVKATQMKQSGAGEFVSYKDGTLTLRGRGGVLIWANIVENYKTFQRPDDGSDANKVGTVEALSKLTPGMAVRVNVDKTEIFFGVDEQTHGTFVSYKDGKLTLIGREEELGPSFTKKYGTTLSPQIDPKTPVFESVDGGAFQPIGTAEVLSSVKEGTIVTLRGKNDRVNLIQLGVPNKAVGQKEKVDQKEKFGFGRFVSFKNGELTLESNSGELIVWRNIAEKTKTFVFEPDAGDYKIVEDGTSALNQVKAGKYMMVGEKRGFIRIGARVEVVRGTFVSFKNDRLLMLGKELPSSFTKKYGNNLHYNRFRDDVPVHQSVDGGDYTQIGTANRVLGDVKEGTLLAIHGEGDDNITLIQIGVPTGK